MRSSILKKYQEPYIRKRENPYFDGMGSGDATLFGQNCPEYDLHGDVTNWNLSLYSAAGSQNQEAKEAALDVAEKIEEMILKSEKPTSDFVLDTYINSLMGEKSTDFNSLPIQDVPSLQMTPNPSHSLDSGNSLDSEHIVDLSNDLVNESISKVNEANAGCYDSTNLTYTTEIKRKYIVHKKKLDLSGISLPQSAAVFYNGYSTQMEVVEIYESTNRLNQYLKARYSDLRDGVPGRFLHAVIGQEVADVGSIVSTIMYAFYLSETLNNSDLCTVPVINMKRAELNAHAEIKWLLDSCDIDQSSLLFIDEIDLPYYNLYGSLKLVLMNSHKLPTKQEALKEALVEIFNCKQVESLYPWVDTVTVGEVCNLGMYHLLDLENGSCCTLVAEKFAVTSPEILAGSFSRLLLAGILLDTENLANAQCSSKDKYTATLLINGAGRFGCNGLFTILKYKMFDISELKVRDILHKDFKRLAGVAGKHVGRGSRLDPSQIGMSSIGLSVGELLSREVSATQEVIYFQKSEKLRLLIIVSGYYDEMKNFKREIMVVADTLELMMNLLHFLDSKASQLPLKALHPTGYKELVRAFEVDNKRTSRKTIERLLEEFYSTVRRAEDYF